MPFLSASWTSITLTRLSALFLLLSSLGITVAAQKPDAARPVIVGAVDESRLVSLTGSHHPLATPSADRGAAPDSLQLGRTILVLKSSALQQSALKKLVDDQQNTHSPHFHQWLTPVQYGAQFGVAPEDIEKITQWLTRYGLQVEPQMAGHNVIMFSGTHAQFKAAFHAELHIYDYEGKSYFANATDPQIPQAFAAVVSGFSSLNNFPSKPLHTTSTLVHHDGSTWKRLPSSNKTQPQLTSKPQPQFTTPDNGGIVNAIGPYDLATIYNIKPLWDAGIDGTDQTIAILAQSNINPSDVDYFRATFGLPAKKLNVIVYGADPGLNLSYEDEADLDVEWAGAVAKNATIDLIVAAPTTTSNGIDGAAAYVINNNLASILNVSYGECEYFLGAAGNAYYNQIWEQAAAQGITVLVATGDSGSASCDAHASYAYEGLQVSGIASTPYNIAVGGTDLYGTYTDNAKYWSTTNDPTTLASVKSYVPELTWNDSCASPELLLALQTSGSTTDATTDALCNDANQPDWLTTTAGSGGYSKCTTAGCTAGYPKPAWQSGVTGIPADSARDLPDVSLMAGNGLYGSFYVYCESDVIAGGACDVNQSLEGGGGTSFAAPVFAGMMALVQQKTASMQGNANYVLYKLATAQYGGSEATSCDSYTVEGGNACTFYDVSHGTIAVPCYTIGLDCTPPTGVSIGILPGFDAAAGYDLGTGLGSVNAYNLVEGWSTASASFLPTATTLTLSPTATAASMVYGSTLPLVVSVAAVAPATGVPSGDVGITTNSATPNNASVTEVTLAAGQGNASAQLLQGGTYQLFARYAGDASFAPSASTGLAVTITPGPVMASLTSTRSTVQQGQKVTLSVALTGVSNGLVPTGTVNISNGTTGVSYGSLQLVSASSSVTAPLSSAYVTINSNQLQLGGDTINASYSGDIDYAPVTLPSSLVNLAGSFTTTINPASITLAANGTGSVQVVVTPSGTTQLTAGSLAFSCPTLAAGIACSFGTPVFAANGTVSSTLTLQLASPLVQSSLRAATNNATLAKSTQAPYSGWLVGGATFSLSALALIFIPKRSRSMLSMLALIASLSIMGALGIAGCSSGGTAKTPVPALIATTTTLSVTPTAPVLGSPAVLTAKVAAGAGSGSPSGMVVFSSGTTTLGTVTVASGSAMLSTSSLSLGTQAITAVYSGDTVYSGSTSAAANVSTTYVGDVSVSASDSAGDQSTAQLAVIVQ